MYMHNIQSINIMRDELQTLKGDTKVMFGFKMMTAEEALEILNMYNEHDEAFFVSPFFINFCKE